MNSTASHQESPLSRLLEDDTLTIIETILPYCRPPLAKMLAVQMKLLEIRKIISGFADEPYLRACGFEETSADLETVLRSLRNSVSEEKAGQIDSILHFIQFSKMYQSWQETIQNHPELMQMLNPGFSRGFNEKDADGSEQMKLLLDYAMKNANGNPHLGEMLSTFMKK